MARSGNASRPNLGDAILPQAVIDATQMLAAPAAGAIGPFGRDGYGLGWIVRMFGGERLIYHIGDFPGTSSVISFMPERNVGMTVFVNEDEVGAPTASGGHAGGRTNPAVGRSVPQLRIRNPLRKRDGSGRAEAPHR